MEAYKSGNAQPGSKLKQLLQYYYKDRFAGLDEKLIKNSIATDIASILPNSSEFSKRLKECRLNLSSVANGTRTVERSTKKQTVGQNICNFFRTGEDVMNTEHPLSMMSGQQTTDQKKIIKDMETIGRQNRL